MKVLNQVKLEMLSKAENVAFARVTVAALASQLDFTISELDDVKVAVSEAVSNAIIHGYQNANKGIVVLLVTIYEDILEVVVDDQGIGIADLEQAMTPSFSTDPERMGLGFVFMQSLMDDLRVKSEPGKGTQVILTKKVHTVPDPCPDC
ncbi:MAG TPA: anti-sigma F factor [Bacillota bacterium]|nr:anti-sigma F factor [Bacillota bacterium]